MKTYFVTYGDNNFRISKNHLIYLAKQSGFFNDSFSFGPKDLSRNLKKYSEVLNKKEVEDIGFGNMKLYLMYLKMLIKEI